MKGKKKESEKGREGRRGGRGEGRKENEFSKFLNGDFLSFLEHAFKCNLTVLRKMGLVSWLSGKKHLSILGKTGVWVPTPICLLTITCNSTSRGIRHCLLTFLGIWHAWGTHTCMHTSKTLILVK